jgi:hypothetical protein
MAILPMQVKRYVVQCNAQFLTPSHVAECVKANFGLEVSPQAIQRYNPTLTAGAGLSEGLVTLFHAARKVFLESVELQPLAHRTVRLSRLNALLDQATEKGLLKLSVSIMAEARKQMQDLEEYDTDDEEPENEEPRGDRS